ncbi:MAG TPA: S-adenosylmethionine:tRNA ribosyltransferase-isomerase [Vicinamibacterales bacterium]|nr:S-adenosylmethionine:tRNA ribosyltransferase-isomerase [Vicinamibacterales bacterium]
MAAAGVMAQFDLPAECEAAEPPEARGLSRDHVRLLISDVAHEAIHHTRFDDLPRWLQPGDLLVVNTSGTLSAALPAANESGERCELHLSTAVPGGFWAVELREWSPLASRPSRRGRPGLKLHLPDGASAMLLAPWPLDGRLEGPSRLWLAAVDAPKPLHEYLAKYGEPIRYTYVPEPWPLSMYQTIFAEEPGSAEMPSAGRPFSAGLVTRLVARGVQIAPLLLHTGVSSLETDEPPYDEFFRVPHDTARRVNAARHDGHRIVAVGTTVVRALATVTDPGGTVHPGEGWTSLLVGPDTPRLPVDSLITGLHEPRATHHSLLERLFHEAARRSPSARGNAGAQLARAYAVARDHGYLWHEFGDAHLVLS